MKRLAVCTLAVAIGLLSLAAAGCHKPYNIQDVDPGQAGRVRSLGPESQDAVRVSDLMMRSLMQSPTIAQADHALTIAMLPVENNTRFPFNKDVFATRLKVELNKLSQGRIQFVARDAMEDIQAEREAKREGEVDYDPSLRTQTVAGADYFLKGRVDGLSGASKQGQSEYLLYTFKLVNAETGIELWEDMYEVKREGSDDVIYR